MDWPPRSNARGLFYDLRRQSGRTRESCLGRWIRNSVKFVTWNSSTNKLHVLVCKYLGTNIQASTDPDRQDPA